MLGIELYDQEHRNHIAWWQWSVFAPVIHSSLVGVKFAAYCFLKQV